MHLASAWPLQEISGVFSMAICGLPSGPFLLSDFN
jgi:hypothetical protein